jgi:hypothetical protein
MLRSGSIIYASELSPNAVLLAAQLGLLDPLRKLEQLKSNVTKDNLQARIELLNLRKTISETLRGSEMDVKYVLAEIMDEQCLYQELLGAYTQERDSNVAKANAASYTINGALWSLTEALTIPASRHPAFAGAAGVVGIVAGVVPSLTAAYGLKQVSGKKHSAAAAPNMLAKLFDRKTTSHVEYPDSVWTFLNSHPTDTPKRTRKDIIIEKWLKDPNIPMLKSRRSEAVLDTLTASTSQKKKVTMTVLSARLIMLARVSAEVSKMNRLLNELELCLRGKKHA